MTQERKTVSKEVRGRGRQMERTTERQERKTEKREAFRTY